MTKNRSAKHENCKILLVGEKDKEGHMSSADTLVPQIIIINNIKSKVPVALTPIEHHKHRCRYTSFEYLLPCKSFICKLSNMKYFLKVINLSQSQKCLNPEKKTIYKLGWLPLSAFSNV